MSRRSPLRLLLRLSAPVVAAALLSTACGEVPSAAPDSPASAKAAPLAPARTPTPPTIAVSDIPAQAESTEALTRDISARLTPGPELSDVEQRISAGETQVKALLALPAQSTSDEVQLVEIKEIDAELRDLDGAASKLEAALSARARSLDADLNRLRELQRLWTATVPEAAELGAPESIQHRAAGTVASIDAVQAEVKRQRNEALTELDRVSRVRSSLEAVRAEALLRRKSAERRLFALAEAPIWRTAWAGRPIGRAAREQLARDARRFKRYLGQSGTRLAGQFLVLFLGSLVLLFVLRERARECAKIDPFARGPLRMIDRPLAAAMLTAVLTLIWTTPKAMTETLFRDTAWVLLILSAAVLLRRLLGPAVTRTLSILSAAACVSLLRYLYEQDPLLDRIVLILQVCAVAATLAADLSTGRWKEAFPERRWQRFSTAVIVTALFFLGAALVLAVIGYVGPARLLRTGVIGSLGIGLICLGAYSLLYGLASTLLTTRPARALRLVQSHADGIRLFLRRAFAALFGFEWIFWSLRVFGLGDDAGRALDGFLKATFDVGSATISVSVILTFLLVLVATFLLAAAIRFLLEGEILPRLNLESGIAFTVSTTARYAVLVGGVLLAFSAAGISLSRVSLLAGALGVGLGFGLQNLVSNFISGLILLFERPIEVGDVVDAGSLLGEVRRIGMRSSTILTAEGAEVVVPNSDLISKSVINWTLSDRRRRIEVKVGVAYGSDPEKVIGLLLQAAADHPEALTTPAPAAYFMGFGDSSLDFVLHVWASRFEQGLALQSAVRRAVHRVLGEAGIEIPFPQRDLNLKSVTPDAAAALRDEKRKNPAPDAGTTAI
jgi:small-conductance mechanosensitive channel